jgi:DNA adenine methylase
VRAPFPWFGGKSRAAHLVWPRFGDVPNYVEPFAGSLAVMLARPDEPRVETVNDKDAYLANFWRALQHDPEGVASWCDGPVNEADLHARHRWLVKRGRRLVLRCLRDPHYFNVKVAGWWVWGQCLWIGSGWCAGPAWRARVDATRNGDTSEQRRRPTLKNAHGVVIKRPAARSNGEAGGVHASSLWRKRFASRKGHHRGLLAEGVRRWQGGGAGGGSGVHAPRLSLDQTKPDLSGSRGASGRGVHSAVLHRSDGLYAYLGELGARLRRVRVCCGDWTRVLTPSVTTYIGVTGVLLDPPYDQGERAICYSEDHQVSADVRRWALEHGDDPLFRIALCGYEGEHQMPATWECVAWKAHGGYSRSERGVANRDRERIWFSPHCLRSDRGQQSMAFDGSDAPVDLVEEASF